MSEFKVTAQMRQFILNELERKEALNKDPARGVHADRDDLRESFRNRLGQGFTETIDELSHAPEQLIVSFPLAYVGLLLYRRETYEALTRQYGTKLTNTAYTIWRPEKASKVA